MFLAYTETGAMYEIEMDDLELAKVAKVLAAAGYTAPTHAEVGMDRDLPGEKGWSNGVDNRSDLGDGTFAQDTWPYRTIGQMKVNGTAETSNGNCTATFVGSAGDANTRYILTASHCMWAVGGAYNDPDFWPRQDRCLTNQGAAIAGCDQGPYGEWDGGQWLMYTFFINNCAGLGSLSTDCQNNDIAIMRVHRQTGASFPGAQGFAYWSKTDLDGVSKFHRGYPNCNGAGDPVPVAPTICLPRTLYGDGAFTIGNGLSVDGDGWPRRYDYSADISPGHSGGPSYFSSGGNHYVFGVASVETCSGSSCTAARPNRMRAVTAHWFNEMLGFMGL
jgi:V8-like Glu-specific endopeptidase